MRGGHPDFLFVSIGTGISAVPVRDGVQYAGSRGAAPELADGRTRLCCDPCGKITDYVLEEVASGPGLDAAYTVLGGVAQRDAASAPVWAAINAGRFFNAAETRYEIDSAQNVELYSLFLDWPNEEYKDDINMVDRSGHFDDGFVSSVTGLGPAFREGRLAMMSQGCWLI